MPEGFPTIATLLSSADYQSDLRRLKQFLPFVGYPANTLRVRILARIHQQMAWLESHLGLSTSSVQEARASIALFQVAFAESGDRGDLKRISQSCLIAANSCLLSHDPQAALRFQNLARQASERVSDCDLSDHHRQRGVALLQIGVEHDEEAKSCFMRAASALAESPEPQTDASVLQVGSGNTCILGHGDWDAAMAVYQAIRSSYRAGNLRMIMAATKVAACGLVLDSPSIVSDSIAILNTQRDFAPMFGHQATRIRLLRLTPELPARLRRPWTRWALYANGFRND